LPEAAVRALAEAAARRGEERHAKEDLHAKEDSRAKEDLHAKQDLRAQEEGAKSKGVNEVGGRGGLDPTRYGDWEINGLASDF
jgi:hypothetical protein